jgi:hypothetical protein
MAIIDANTGRVVNATSVEGKPREIGGGLGISLAKVAFGSEAFYETPIGQAVRDCINTAVDFIVKTAFPNYAQGNTPSKTQPVADEPTAVNSTPEPSQAVTLSKPESQPEPIKQICTVKSSHVNVREGPGLKYPIITTLDKGTKLEKLEQSGNWVQVMMDDGRIGWIYGKLIE